jgi:hypothetical protein
VCLGILLLTQFQGVQKLGILFRLRFVWQGSFGGEISLVFCAHLSAVGVEVVREVRHTSLINFAVPATASLTSVVSGWHLICLVRFCNRRLWDGLQGLGLSWNQRRVILSPSPKTPLAVLLFFNSGVVPTVQSKVVVGGC